MILVPFARALYRGWTPVSARLDRAWHRHANRLAVERMAALDPHMMRDLGVNPIALARARLAPRGSDPVAVLRREVGQR